MAKIPDHRAYLEEFRAEVVEGLREALSEHSAALNGLSFAEDDEGVWAEASVELPGLQEPWVRRRLIIPAQGPDKDAWLAGMVFSSALVEELDRRPS
ncbi:hypothetical protein [Streptomyces sp. NRRL S-475]|uniref:hypothetical protein n=1 Tax=Streptomyces sp. NRRL S-475 TaxID=1463910 RepID=UPI0004C88F16|nr:hypothetical protein [Streptomyces sp. NRRL S-475]